MFYNWLSNSFMHFYFSEAFGFLSFSDGSVLLEEFFNFFFFFVLRFRKGFVLLTTFEKINEFPWPFFVQVPDHSLHI